MDKIDPICGMEGHIKAHNHYFCSETCIRKYEKQNNLKKQYIPKDHTKQKKWYKQKIFIFGFIAILLFIFSYLIPFLNPVFDALLEYLKLIWWAILLGFLIGGIIDYYIPREYIQKFLAKRKKRTVFFAVIFGFLMSACSHGILAISMELYKKGASTASTIAFLLASPWANLPITILLFGFFGIKALFLIVGAIIIAIITGLIYQILERKGKVETHKSILKDKFSIKEDLKKRFKNYSFSLKKDTIGVSKGAWSLAKMVLWWILIGMIFASFARAYIPQHFFMTYMGASILGMVVTLILATIIEVCSEGSSPMAFEIYNQTNAFGNSFIFLMAGVATDYTEIGLIWSNIGKKAAIWLPIITVPQILILGYLFNIVF